MQLRLEVLGIGARPYPLDRERRRRIMVALAEKEMTISDLAQNLGISRELVSYTINGRRLSLHIEQRIADHLGKLRDYLFPPRTMEEIIQMRNAEAAEKGRAA